MHALRQRLCSLGCLLIAAGLLAACSSTPEGEAAGWSNEKLYSEAKSESSAGNLERAAKLFETLEGRAAGTLIAQQAQIERAHVLYRQGERSLALSALDRFIKLHPSSPGFEYALYLQGLVNFNENLGILGSLARQDLSERDQQASRDAYQSFKRLVEQFPNSVYAEDSRLRMDYIVNALASYEVHVARYYFRRGAYVAAINRAQQAVQEFQHSPAAEEALAIMVHSYDRLGMDKLRDDAQRVLKQNFPSTSFTAANIGQRQAAWWQLW